MKKGEDVYGDLLMASKDDDDEGCGE